MTPSGIEPATFRFVAQHLNNRATTVPVIPWVHTLMKCAVHVVVLHSPSYSFVIYAAIFLLPLGETFAFRAQF